jgi:hypothetical protein
MSSQGQISIMHLAYISATAVSRRRTDAQGLLRAQVPSFSEIRAQCRLDDRRQCGTRLLCLDITVDGLRKIIGNCDGSSLHGCLLCHHPVKPVIMNRVRRAAR